MTTIDCPACGWAMQASSVEPGAYICVGDQCPDFAKVRTLVEIDRQRQAQREAIVSGVAVCECGHTRYQHNVVGRCRAQRHRCTCRTFAAQTSGGPT